MSDQSTTTPAPMRLLVTGGTGVLGRALRLEAEGTGHELVMPRHDELDLFDPIAVADAVRGFDAVLHLATRIQPIEKLSDREAWRENDRLRTEASRILVDAALAGGVQAFVQPTVTFVYPDGAVTEDTPLGAVMPLLESALDAERETERFARSGRRGVVLRLGLLDGPGTGLPEPLGNFGATVHTRDAARALLDALALPSGMYNVCRDGERVSNERFAAAAGWRPGPWLPQRRRELAADGAVPDLAGQCEVLRSLHRPGDPLLLPNAWDVATARAVVAAGHPVVATTSGAVARSIGYEDHENAPGDEMLAAAARIVRGVDVPVTVDAEAGYGMAPAELVSALSRVGAAGCNLEDWDYEAGELRDPAEQAEWLAAVRRAADDADYPLVVNARIDVFVGPYLSGPAAGHQDDLVTDAIERAHAYLDAGADCVFPILLWEPEALRRFMAEADGPVNILQLPEAPPPVELAALGVARISWGFFLHMAAMTGFERQVAALRI
jgi:2-methylisocitrate lyase-like PEP mutase family enzyme